MNKLMIALLVPTLDGGGAQRVMINLANEFSAIGVDVWFLTRNEGDYLGLVSPSVKIYNLPFKKFAFNLFSIAKFLAVYRPTTMMSTLDSANILAPFAKILSLSSTKIVVREANTLDRFGENNITFRKYLALWKMRFSYRLSDKIIANSDDTKDDLYRYRVINPKKIVEVIANPVFSESIVEKGDMLSSHPWVTNRDNYILSVGRLHPAKDHESLIRAVALLNEAGNDIKLIILGEGQERDRLYSLARGLGIENNLDMPGFQENPYPFYKNASMFCLTSRWEGFGNVLVEALAFGLPVISTDCPGGPKMILGGGRYGLLVPVGNVLEVSSAIEKVLRGKSSFNASVQLSRAKDFSIKEVAKSYLSILK